MDDGFLRCWEKRPRPWFSCSATMPQTFFCSPCFLGTPAWSKAAADAGARAQIHAGVPSARGETTQNTDKVNSHRTSATFHHSPTFTNRHTHTNKGSDSEFERRWCHIWYRRNGLVCKHCSSCNIKLKVSLHTAAQRKWPFASVIISVHILIAIIHTCNHLPWPLTFLVLFGPDGFSGVHRPPQVFPLQIRHTRRLRVLQEAPRTNITVI